MALTYIKTVILIYYRHMRRDALRKKYYEMQLTLKKCKKNSVIRNLWLINFIEIFEKMKMGAFIKN